MCVLDPRNHSTGMTLAESDSPRRFVLEASLHARDLVFYSFWFSRPAAHSGMCEVCSYSTYIAAGSDSSEPREFTGRDASRQKIAFVG